MILRQAKNPQSGRACAPGGSARQVAGDPPPDGRIVEFLIAVGREAPCGPKGRLRGRLRAGRVGVRGRAVALDEAQSAGHAHHQRHFIEENPMETDLKHLTARLSALETIILDMMDLAASKAPHLRQDIVRNLTRAAEDMRDLGDDLEAQAITVMRDSFRESS